jgi:hypothetical protein
MRVAQREVNLLFLFMVSFSFFQRVHIEWQRPLSGVPPIMMEKLAQAGEGGECTPAPSNYITYKDVAYAPAEWALGRYTHPIHLYQYMYSVVFFIEGLKGGQDRRKTIYFIVKKLFFSVGGHDNDQPTRPVG